jgi:colanic acid biosynthesis glycosyl transferase WcaI
MGTRSTVWVVSELYFPEETSTGFLLTQIAEGIAKRRRVSVVCAQPTYAMRGTRAPIRETRNGVDIHRCFTTTFDKDRLVLRLLNLITISLAIFFELLLRLRRTDTVLVVTNPPSLPFLAVLATKLRGARAVLIVHDVYPDVVAASGLARREGTLFRLADRLHGALYRSFVAIVALGRDMERLVARKLDGARAPIVIVPNWAELESIHPVPREECPLLRELSLGQKFVVQYAGNMGHSHDVESILRAARTLGPLARYHFLFIGSGAKKAAVERAARAPSPGNVTLLGQRPRSDQQNFLNACDVAVIAFMPGMAGISVPSRMYNILAAGKPIVAIADAGSELALVVQEERVGWVVDPSSSDHLVDVLRAAEADPVALAAMGDRARRVAEQKYSLDAAVEGYRRLLDRLDRLPRRRRESAG